MLKIKKNSRPEVSPTLSLKTGTVLIDLISTSKCMEIAIESPLKRLMAKITQKINAKMLSHKIVKISAISMK